MHDVARRETIERPTSELGVAKVTEIWRTLVASDQEVWSKHLLLSVVRSF